MNTSKQDSYLKDWQAQEATAERPQTLQLAADRSVLQLQVDVVEYLGMESLLVGKLVGAGEGRVTAVVPGQRADLMRQTVGLDMDPQALHVFDKASGNRIAV